MSNPHRRHSILDGVSQPSPQILDSLLKKQGRAYEVYQALVNIMDTPYDAFVALLIWYHCERKDGVRC